MAWSKTPPQLFIGGIFFEENCGSFSWLGLLFCAHLDSTPPAEWRGSRQDPALWTDNIWVAHPKRKRLEFLDVGKLLSS